MGASAWPCTPPTGHARPAAVELLLPGRSWDPQASWPLEQLSTQLWHSPLWVWPYPPPGPRPLAG